MLIHHTLFSCCAMLVLSLSAISGGSYQLTRISINGGGGMADSAEWQLRSTLGQPQAGISGGEDYALQVGFWTASDIGSIFEDGFEETP